MKTQARRLALAATLSLSLLAGGLGSFAGTAAYAANTAPVVDVAHPVAEPMIRVYRGGGLTLVCFYDDVSGALAYCDVYH